MLTPEQIERILRLAEDGEKQRAISRITGHARDTIRSIIKKNNLGEIWARRPESTKEFFSKDKPPRRCKKCGRMVHLPCLACHLEAIKKEERLRKAPETLSDEEKRRRKNQTIQSRLLQKENDLPTPKNSNLSKTNYRFDIS
ncbi:MAG: hypothetical protein MPJ24_02050 [Pirellulaceae bacterium]|nr:hypothetical protein [Pirellulaceae bacterium]